MTILPATYVVGTLAKYHMENIASVVIEEIIGENKFLVIGIDNYESFDIEKIGDKNQLPILNYDSLPLASDRSDFILKVAAFDGKTLNSLPKPLHSMRTLLNPIGDPNYVMPDPHQFVEEYLWMCVDGATPQNKDEIDTSVIKHRDVTCTIHTADAMKMFVRLFHREVHFANLSNPEYVLMRSSDGGIYATTIDTLISYWHCNTLNERAYSELMKFYRDADNQTRNGECKNLENFALYHETVLFHTGPDMSEFTYVNITSPEELTVFMDYVSARLQNEGHTEASKMLDAWFEI